MVGDLRVVPSRFLLRSSSARSKPLTSIEPKQLAEDGEAGVERPRAMSPWLMMMMVVMMDLRSKGQR